MLRLSVVSHSLRPHGPWPTRLLCPWGFPGKDTGVGCHLVVVQSLSHVRLFVTSWTAACQASLFITVSWSLLKLMSIESVMPSNHLILCHTLLLLPSIFPSNKVFPNESSLYIRWPKYWHVNISPSNEYSGLISPRINWFDLLGLQRTLQNLLQHHSLKASIFLVLSLLYGPYLTSRKTIALTIQTFVSKVLSLLFNTLSRFVITISAI